MSDITQINLNGVDYDINDAISRLTIHTGEYDTTASYNAGDYCWKDDVLYLCTSPTGNPAGTWDATKWSAVTLTGELKLRKKLQMPVTNPTASGNATAFIDSISQDAQGVITVTKKNVNLASVNKIYYGQCATSAATADKIVAVADSSFSYTSGIFLVVHFDHGNVTTATLNVNNLGAKAIKWHGGDSASTYPDYIWADNAFIMYTYDGTAFNIVDNGSNFTSIGYDSSNTKLTIVNRLNIPSP